jgi:hypothetical protein
LPDVFAYHPAVQIVSEANVDDLIVHDPGIDAAGGWHRLSATEFKETIAPFGVDELASQRESVPLQLAPGHDPCAPDTSLDILN